MTKYFLEAGVIKVNMIHANGLKPKGHDVKQMSNLPATIPSNNFRCSQVLQPLSHRKIRKVTNLCNASLCVYY
jgi:hypothetical protein